MPNRDAKGRFVKKYKVLDLSEREQLKKAIAEKKAIAQKSTTADGFWTNLSGGNGGSYDIYQQNPNPQPNDFLNAYQSVDIIYACVSLIVNNMAGFAHRIRLHATTNAGQSRPRSPTRALTRAHKQRLFTDFPKHTSKAVNVEEVTDHAILGLLNKPNPHQDFGKLLGITQLFLDTCGSSFWYLACNAVGEVKEIWVLPTQQMDIVVDDRTGEIKEYVQHAETDFHFKPKDIIHFRHFNPFDPYTSFGVSPMLPVWQIIQLLRQEQSSWQAVLQNLAYPSLLISPGDEMTTITSGNAERYQKELRNMFSLGNQGGPLVVMDFLNITPLNPPPKNMAAMTMYDQIRKRIAATYAVPIPLIDMEDQNGQAVNTANRFLQMNCLKPRLVNILETVTNRLCPDRLFLAVDNIVEPDLTFELQRTSALFQAGLITQNEARATQGLDARPNGDKLVFDLMGGNNSGIGTLPSFQSGDKGIEPNPFIQPNPLLPVWYALQQLRKEQPSQKALPSKEKNFRAFQAPDPSKLAIELADIYSQIANSISPSLKSVPKKRAKNFIEVSDWSSRIADQLAPILRLYYDEGANSVFAGIGVDDELRRLNALNLDKAVAQASLALADSTLNTTNMEIDRAVAELRAQIETGLSVGEANRQLTERVQTIFTDLTRERAYLIAETESARAKMSGELMAVQDSGVKAKKKWLPDNMACDLCKDLDGVTKSLDEPFVVRGPGPYGTVDNPPLHPACRCTLQYDFEE